MSRTARRIDLLIQAYHQNSPDPDSAVAAQLSRQLGQIVSPAAVKDYSSGATPVRPQHLAAIGDVLKAPEGFFEDTPAASEAEARLALLLEIRHRFNGDGINIIARGTRLSDQATTELAEFFGVQSRALSGARN